MHTHNEMVSRRKVAKFKFNAVHGNDTETTVHIIILNVSSMNKQDIFTKIQTANAIQFELLLRFNSQQQLECDTIALIC